MQIDPSSKLQRSKVRQLITVWGFLLLALVAGFITINAYIGNSKEAKKRYDALVATDSAGGDVEKSLLELRTYIYGHMNTTLGNPTGVKPVIQLKGTYDHLVVAEQARIKQANDDAYGRGQQECQKQFPIANQGKLRIACITQFVTSNIAKEQPIPEALYKFDFASPVWSPDLAGYGILATSVLFVIFLYRAFVYQRMLHYIKTSS